MQLAEFYHNKKVLVTGHTGFKGSWICTMLLSLGAEVCGYSHQEYPLFQAAEMRDKMESHLGDIRNRNELEKVCSLFQPEIIFHLAAQPLVQEGYQNPRDTYDVNMMGTVNLLECARTLRSLHALVNVTTDKVYWNDESGRLYEEADRLGGEDPYACSKSCSDLITASYRKSFFGREEMAHLATARAGNVIGGGDWSENRILPDCIRAAQEGKPIVVRNKDSVRPWQHVLEPLYGYLLLGKALYEGTADCYAFNFGPEEKDCVSVGELVSFFCDAWGNTDWKTQTNEQAGHEAGLLRLDSSKAKHILGFKPQWEVRKAVQMTVDWQKDFSDGRHAYALMCEQIKEFLGE